MTVVRPGSSVVDLVDDSQIRAGCQALVEVLDGRLPLPVPDFLRAVTELAERQEGRTSLPSDEVVSDSLPDLEDVVLVWGRRCEPIQGDLQVAAAGGGFTAVTHTSPAPRKTLTATRRHEMLTSLEAQEHG